MNGLVRHRGPDGEGFALLEAQGGVAQFVGADGPAALYTPETRVPERDVQMTAGVALGHRRLSIVDLSPAGHQPMSMDSGRYWIAYNGEIYNHVEVRAELEAAGRRFSSGSDTEVILQAYAHWGRACLDRFNGMFAFVLVDVHEQRLLAARDRFGVKPLYHWRSPEGFVAFASEIKQFTVLPGWRAVLNRQRADDFLTWGVSDHTAETMFEGVGQLRGGEYVEQGWQQFRSDITIKRWYNLPQRHVPQADPNAPKELRQLLEDAVRLRLRADVEVGSCLSGGLDSSTIVSLVHRELQRVGQTASQNTFSARSDVKALDEYPYAKAVVDQTRAQAHQVTPTAESLTRSVESLVWHQDEPFGSTGIYMQWAVFELASANGVRVMLDGQGADELLAGYDTFVAARQKGLLVRRHLIRFAFEWLEVRKAFPRSAFRLIEVLRFLVSTSLTYQQAKGFWRFARALPKRAVRWAALVLLPEQWVQAYRDRQKTRAGQHVQQEESAEGVRLAPYQRAAVPDSDVAAISRAQYTWANLPMLLHWADRNSMAHSVESRLPFMDVRVAEFGVSLPEEQRVKGATTKVVLREAMRGIVPDMVIDRRDKLGFSTPEERWLLRDASRWTVSALELAVEYGDGVLPAAALSRGKAMLSGAEPYSRELWRWISFGLWMKAYRVKLSNDALEA